MKTITKYISEDGKEFLDEKSCLDHEVYMRDLIKSWEAYAKNNGVHDHKGFYDNFYKTNLGPGNGKERD